MKKAISFLLFAFLVILVFISCSRLNTLKVTKMNFTDQIDQFQNIQFSFDHEIVSDSLINKWDSTAFIQFEPPIAGRFRWTGRRDLEFSPAGPFAPNTEYKATLTRLITNHTKVKYTIQDPVFNFHTPYLEIAGSNSYWALNEGIESEIELHIMLTFNYPVNFNEVVKYIRLGINGKERSYRLVPGDQNTSAELAISADQKENFSSIEVTMLPGMKCIGSDRQTTEAVKIAVIAPANDRLDITDVTAEFEDGMGIINVYTSQPVLMQGISKYISVDPLVEFDVSALTSGFQLRGEFSDDKSYQLVLRKGIKGMFGPELNEDLVQTVTFGSLKPYIAFADESGMYLTPGGSGNLGLKLINIPKVKITVFKIFENNIQHFLRKGMDWDWYSGDDEYYESYQYSLDENYGQVVSSREFSTNALPKKGNLRLLHLSAADLHISDDLKGIYLIKAESSDKVWLNDVQLLSFSDIGLIVKEGENEIFVATRSIATAQPEEGVTVSLYSKNNQVVNKLVTGRDGVAIFRDIEKNSKGFKIAMITARKGDDFNVLAYSRSNIDLTRFEVGGKHTSGREFDAFMYGDRDLYRPGDSVHINMILRDFGFKNVTGFPVILRVISPDGKDFLKKKLSISSTGSSEVSFILPEKTYTGTYTCELLTVSNILVSSYRIKAEEFMPDRISVTLKADKEDYLPGERLKLTVTAMNLFGPPASGRKIENELRVNRSVFLPKSYAKKYNFNLYTLDEMSVMSEVNQTVTGANGVALQEFQLPAFTNSGLYEGKIYTTVFDETGRPVNRIFRFNLYTQEAFLGISKTPDWLNSGSPVKMNFISLNKKEKPVATKARVEVVRVDWQTVIERNYGQVQYRSQQKEKVISSREITIPVSGFDYSFIPQESGSYKVRLSLPGSNTYVQQEFYAYSYGFSDENSFMVNKDGQIDISFDKATYQPGQEAKILFKTPFSGELFVTVEQNKVLSYYSLKADNNGAVLNLDIKDDFIPNVYITATLIRKAEEGGIPLTVAHGFNSMAVERLSDKLPVFISSPDQIRSGVNQKITVKTSPGAEVTLAVVDEGILQITDYKTPDPYGYFYAKRALEVDSYDIYDELLPELSPGKSKTGGDQGFDLGKRLNPLTAKRVKLLSLWSGRLIANNNGEITITAKIPQFSGAVRIMAAAQKNNQFGSAEKRMRIADPVTISSSISRFLSPGDEAAVFVTLTNTTAKPIDATLSVKTNVPLKASAIAKPKITIPANSEVRTSYILSAGNNTGISLVIFQASTSSESFTEKTELSVRPAVPMVKQSEAGTLAAGKTNTFTAKGNFLKGTSRSRLMITKNPVAQFASHLEQLVNYPYGCIEQTISAAFPQLYFQDIADLLKAGHIGGSGQVNYNVNEAIIKIGAYQQYNGGVITWPGFSEINWWNTAYAAHFLYEAERAGYTVDKRVTDNMQKFLLEKVKLKETTEYFYYNEPSNKYIPQRLAKREIFYSLFVLALNGKQHLPTMNYFKARPELLTTESKYMLASAYRLIGDVKSYNAILPQKYGTENSSYMTGESYGSPLRNKALALYVLLTADADNPQIALLVSQLGQMVDKATWMSTQENVYTVLALGKLAKNMPSAGVEAKITTGTRTINFKDKNIIIDLYQNNATVAVNGKGTLYWFLETEGIPLKMSVKEEDKVLRVRRKLLTRNGAPATNIKQNDLLVVELALNTTDGSNVDNVVITDMLPACFEIENSRLNAERDLPWATNRTIPDYQDIRDDRINIFTTATPELKVFYYMVRVVNKGTYTHGPVGAEAMYYGQYFSYFGFGKITVK